jgi:hypothetical protein
MPEPIDAQHFTGAHPTCREFVAKMAGWGFKERGQDGVHALFRGPHGGTVRVLRSLAGRADPAVVEKAARLAGVTPAQFWAGPQGQPGPTSPQNTARGGQAPRRKPAARDTVTSLVLAVHAEVDRPLGFDQIAELSGHQVTRDQVATASAALCRDGQLDRIRSGVYQWSGGQRAARQIPAPRPRPRPAPEPVSPAAPQAPEPPAGQPPHVSAADLFGHLFPAGVQMTGELLADLEHWMRLTGKLAAHNKAAS